MAELTIEVATMEDLDVLAELNKQMNEDQRHDNPLDIEQLKKRIRSFLESGDYKAYLFKEVDKIRGYALIDHSRDPLYMRHFFISRDSRRSGYGRRSFEKLMRVLNADQIDIHVFVWNERGQAFWEALGFKPRNLNMRWKSE